MIRKENRNYKMKQGETAKIFFCDEYCREQGQGHTHLFDSLYRINIDKDIDIRFFKEENGKYTYECKCSYYWEHVLKFNGNFTSDEKKSFHFVVGGVNMNHIKYQSIANLLYGIKKKIKFLREYMVHGYFKDMYLNVFILSAFILFFL